MLAKLSYPMKKKAKRLIELKNKLDNTKLNKWLIGLMIISAIYTLAFSERYLTYLPIDAILQSLLDTEVSTTNSFIKIIDFTFLGTLIITTSATYLRIKSINKIKDKFQTLREDIISELDTDLCLCNAQCTCKDDFIKYMEEKDINLIFK
ncbi:hypothetical protein [Acetohalobium arabaticum]|uniref:Uncharacterized protein n=1 Tax=Acetohalobium arabaticum (strain ATCC 49924 / DSM 5501 / Z-7288) TaxID=574087 RepID=D9QQW2_ACEAZ|nr:hypothetical protein [Acetohalobium arabaticum]ADL12903.1 hypothetical protein Acear_1393 [Acetohalobium arabaticum DSM 5501]